MYGCPYLPVGWHPESRPLRAGARSPPEAAKASEAAAPSPGICPQKQPGCANLSSEACWRSKPRSGFPDFYFAKVRRKKSSRKLSWSWWRCVKWPARRTSNVSAPAVGPTEETQKLCRWRLASAGKRTHRHRPTGEKQETSRCCKLFPQQDSWCGRGGDESELPLLSCSRDISWVGPSLSATTDVLFGKRCHCWCWRRARQRHPLRSCSVSPKNSSALRLSSATDLGVNPNRIYA